MKKKFILLSLMIAAAFTASATITKTIGDPTKVAGTYDYTSLYAAGLALSTTPLTDDAVWLICTDLDETMNVGINNNTQYSLTIRPNEDADRVITYSSTVITADNSGPSGNVVIGGKTIETADNGKNIPWTHTPAKNITIDGYAEGHTTRRLTFTSNTIGSTTISVFGDVTNTVIKNCRILETKTDGTNYAITLRPEKNTNYHPVDVLIDNCYIKCSAAVSSYGIYFWSTQATTADGRVENTTVNNCEIIASMRGAWLRGVNSVNFLGCTFHLPSAPHGYLSHGILGDTESGIINVKGCKFLELKTKNTAEVTDGVHGIRGITASGGATVWNIENNIFTGLDALASGVTSKSIEVCGIRCGDSCVVRHNTFVMPSLTYKPATPLVSTRNISLLYLAGSKKYIVKNNIFISHETVAHNSLIRGALNVNCGHNVFYHDGGNAAIVGGAAIVTDSAALVTADPTSNWKEVEFDENMELTMNSIGSSKLAVPMIAEVPKDINGVDRLNVTYAGAEAPGLLAANMYLIGGNNNFDPTLGVEMEEISAGEFMGVFEFSTAKNLAFSSVLAENNDQGGWDYVNAHRFAGEIADQALTDGSLTQMVYGVDRSFSIAAGKYVIIVNVVSMKVRVTAYVDNLYIFDNISGDWVLGNGTSVTKTGENIFEIEYGIPEGKNIIFSTTHGAGWDDVNAGRLYIDSDGNYWVDGDSEAGITATVDINKTFLIKAGGRYLFTVNLNTKKIAITQLSAFVDMTSAGYATYYNSKKAFVVPADMTGYVFNMENGLVEAYTGGEIVEAGRALVLGSDNVGLQELEFMDNVTPQILVSQLHGSDAAAMTNTIFPGDYVYYGLSLAQGGDPATVGFYYMAAGGAAFENGAHKAFLAVPVLAGFLAPERILFNNNNATGIENVEGQDQAVKFIQNGQLFIQKNGVVYDAMGRVVR